tara:strand:+ start:770 stop:1381 length:612 start_codon:yes stop_codon:yes gene_type:complete
MKCNVIDNIKKQVRENPLTKEDSKEQFYRLTKELDVKHTFDFDEAWEIGLEIRKRKDFRKKVSELEGTLMQSGVCDTGKSLNKTNPVKHTFADGCYIRQIFNPANEIIITKVHKKEHPFFLMKGKMSILTEEGIEHLKAPYQGITKPGTKRVIYTHEECVFITVHATDKVTVEDVEEEVVCATYRDLPPELDILTVLKQINLK